MWYLRIVVFYKGLIFKILILKIKYAQIIFWWLSVDYFYKTIDKLLRAQRKSLFHRYKNYLQNSFLKKNDIQAGGNTSDIKLRQKAYKFIQSKSKPSGQGLKRNRKKKRLF